MKLPVAFLLFVSTAANAQFMGPNPASPMNIAIGAGAAVHPPQKETTIERTNDPLVVICNEAQAVNAFAWQKFCERDTTLPSSYCPILSYQRFCDSASRAETRGLKPLRPHYQNVFRR